MKHDSEYLLGSDGNRLFTQCWRPDGNPKSVLIVSHGYAEHSGRYAHVGEFFANHGCLVCAVDHRAHGRSDGKDTYIESFDNFLADLDLFVAESRAKAPGKPAFLLGHSMGGEIAVAYAIKYLPELTGVLLSAPSIVLGDDISPVMIKLAAFLSKVAPKLKTIKLDSASVSRDPEVIARYDSDPLNYRGGVPARTGAEINKTI
ncbi:MAG: lysophospholipase, partial [Spirochaetaceae bacterium]|nr:lysophospholipase [Spirochaetaceae bacterium]